MFEGYDELNKIFQGKNEGYRHDMTNNIEVGQ